MSIILLNGLTTAESDLNMDRVGWDQVKPGDKVFIDYLDYQAEGQSPVRQIKGPHFVQSVPARVLNNGNGMSQFGWPESSGSLLRPRE